MNDVSERRAVKALEGIGWTLKRVAYVLEAMTKGAPRGAKACTRCGSWLQDHQANACAVCDLSADAPPDVEPPPGTPS